MCKRNDSFSNIGRDFSLSYNALLHLLNFPISNLKAKFAHRTKNHGPAQQWPFEGKGVRVKSVVTLWGADISPQHKTTICKILCPWKNDWNALVSSILLISKIGRKFEIKGTSVSAIFGSKQNWVSKGVFVETCAHTLLSPMFSCTLVHLCSCLHCSVQLTGARVAPGWPQYCQPITEEHQIICFALIGPLDVLWRWRWRWRRKIAICWSRPSYRQGPW